MSWLGVGSKTKKPKTSLFLEIKQWLQRLFFLSRQL